MANRYYVGRRDGKTFVFRSAALPTQATHGHLYASVVGPFRAKRAAVLLAVTTPNPHIQSVSDAERIANR